MFTVAESLKRSRQAEAVRVARDRTEKTGRKHVVRDDREGRFFVCPLYASGQEGRRSDPGYAALGTLVRESL